jgi:tyrosine-protein phosphatase SIW14
MKHLTQRWRYYLGLSLLIAVACSITAYAFHQRRHYRNFLVVKPGVLYRSGQLSPKALERILYEHNIGTVISLRGNTQGQQNSSVEWEERLCFKNFVHHIALPLGSTEQRAQVSPGDSFKLVDTAARQFLQIMSDPVTYPRPVLVHCLAGIHRTGVMAALYRIEKQGWTKEQALAEMKALGYDDFIQYDPVRDYVVNWK